MVTILCVDDDTAQLTLLRMLFKHTPYTLLTAQSAAEALSIVHEQVPDLILLDVAMPNVDGLQLLHVLCAEPQFASLKVILVTALPRRIPPEDAASVFRVVTKPYTIERLEEAVNAALNAAV
jgi:CheY-like chemotaxis protein